ncbi:hypothetical protein V6N11_079401 [Hibiscus sabdariffa]|uniref:Uncharacterized protein n=1 Tax=Hibiscus sabdariffa TaxID=183260 RepID=A0ABR2RVZ1_9ROSI
MEMKAWSCPGPYPKIVLEKTARKVLDHLRVHGSSVRSSWPQTPYAGFIWLKSALPILARLTSIYDQIQALFEAGAFARLVALKPLCDLLVCDDPNTVMHCLVGLVNIMEVGEADKTMSTIGGANL